MPPNGSNKATSHPAFGFKYGHFLWHSVGDSNENDDDDDGDDDDDDNDDDDDDNDDAIDDRDFSAAILDRATNSLSPSNKAPHFVKKDFLVALVSFPLRLLLLLPFLLLSSWFHNRSIFGKASSDRRFHRVQSTSPSASKVRINRARSAWLDPIPIGLPSTIVTTASSLLPLLCAASATNDAIRCFATEAPTGPFPITMYDDTDDGGDDDTSEWRAPEEEELEEPTRNRIRPR